MNLKSVNNGQFFLKKEANYTDIFIGEVVFISKNETYNDEKRNFRTLEIWKYGKPDDVTKIHLEATTYISKKALDSIVKGSIIYLEAKLLPESYYLNTPFFEIENLIKE